MKLVRFGPKGSELPGILVEGQRRDCSKFFEDWNRSFFNNDGLDKLDQILKKDLKTLPFVDERIRWGSPIARPGMIMCIGLNYSDHALESGMEIPSEPVIFSKVSNTICGPYDEVVIPKGSEKTDWEVELGVVLKNDVSYLESEQEAWDNIAGFCIVHDVSERAFQLEKGGQWVKGKSSPGFTPVGPLLVTKDEISDINNLNLSLSVNNEERQKGNTKFMVFDVKHIVWYLSQYMQLEAGDLISTGTPPGVGLGMKPPTYLVHKDQVDLTIEGLGSQKQTFVRYPNS